METFRRTCAIFWQSNRQPCSNNNIGILWAFLVPRCVFVGVSCIPTEYPSVRGRQMCAPPALGSPTTAPPRVFKRECKWMKISLKSSSLWAFPWLDVGRAASCFNEMQLVVGGSLWRQQPTSQPVVETVWPMMMIKSDKRSFSLCFTSRILFLNLRFTFGGS